MCRDNFQRVFSYPAENRYTAETCTNNLFICFKYKPTNYDCSFQIVLKRTLPMQADGEPWMQSPCDINIQHYGQATMLKDVKN